ncbi:hypothetical protein ACFPFX_34990 [Streptomyces mauvecolor]|uniref:Uncharacterized protein n=1 Tax=Streptomyces mauvecolor TaxID=58345 RepID=A0ABV9UYS1_9ACTN
MGAPGSHQTTIAADAVIFTPSAFAKQILHRAGLIQRTRSSRHVLYQRLPAADPV